jgi:hypothetical protein
MSYTLSTGLILSQQQYSKREVSIMSNLPTKLNKSQQRDIAKILVNGISLGDDYMARGLSALYRSAMKTSQQDEILAIALAYGVVSNNEFIISTWYCGEYI